MLNTFKNKVRTFIFSSGENEPPVNVDRKRKRPFEESEGQLYADSQFSAVKKPKLQKQESTVFSGILNSSTVQRMSDWVHKNKPSLFSWGSQKDGRQCHARVNGNGFHNKRDGRNGRHADRSTHQSSTHHDFPVSRQGTWPMTDSIYSNNRSRQGPPLSRVPLRTNGTQTNIDPDDIDRQSVSSSQDSRSCSGVRSMFNMRNKHKFTAKESVRLDEKVRYQELLQKFTTVPLQHERPADSKPPEAIKHPVCVSQLPRFYFKCNDSILGSSLSKDMESLNMDAHRPRERPKLKVTPSHKSTPRPHVMNGHATSHEQSMVAITDISAIPSVQTDASRKSPIPYSIDLTDEPEDVLFNKADIIQQKKHERRNLKSPVQSDRNKDSKFLSENWVKNLTSTYSAKARERERQLAEAEIKAKIFDERREEEEKMLERKIRIQMKLCRRQPAVVEDLPVEISSSEDEYETEPVLPELTPEMSRRINASLQGGNSGEVMVEKFRLQITRNDLSTLAGHNWLNDEVINFYMNMLMERGEGTGKAKVYAFNTFFYPKVMSGGQSAVKRWTRRVDVLAVDYILIPVHLGMHWCLAVINFKKKSIQYYDSMGGNNTQCLNALKQYLCDESLDKKKKEFDLAGWKSEIVKDNPQQMNGSDCGMFACKYAEYITREAPITFTQEHMPYFRRRMVYEIVTAKLLQ